MRRDTFSLTAIKENNYSQTTKLPELSSGQWPEGRFTKTISRIRTQGSLGPTKHKAIKDLLSNIRNDSERLISSKVGDSEFLGTVQKLESTPTVKETINILHGHVLEKKKQYNKLISLKKTLQQEILRLNSKLIDVTSKDKLQAENCAKYGDLTVAANEIQNKILQEKQYSENLKYMINSRRDLLVSIYNPTHELCKEIKETDTRTKNLHKVVQHNESTVRAQRNALVKIQEDLNAQRETTRITLNKELKVFQDRSKAVAFYKQSQGIWYNLKKMSEKENVINKLEQLKKQFSKQEALKEELRNVQETYNVKEANIAQALQTTSTSSLEELGERFTKLKESKVGLEKLQQELKTTLQRQAEDMVALNDKLDGITIEKQIKDTSDSKSFYGLEKQLNQKSKMVEHLAYSLNIANKNSSAVVLSLNRLIQKISDETGDPTLKNLKGIREAFGYLLDKVKEII